MTNTIAGSAAGTVRTSVFDSTQDVDGKCGTFGISNRSTSAGPVYVIVNGLHGSNSAALGPGVSWPFRNSGGITSVQIYGDGSNAATVDWGVLVR